MNEIVMGKNQENTEDDNLMTLEGIGKELLNKIVDKVEIRYNNKDNKQKNIYSFLGYNILIAVNPYGDFNKIKSIYYTKEIRKIYEDYFRNITNSIAINPPKAHIYYLIEDAYRKMLKDKEIQNFIITGDSGSGKTESTKLILQYLTDSNNDEISKNIMDSNPLLEAFGNAKTVRNDNSSRFGKFIEINFSKDGKILNAIIKSYLLEKSRVVQIQEGEENFKIFYLFILGKNEEEEKEYKIKSLDYYKYLRNEKYIENNGNIKYRENFEQIKNCLSNFKFTEKEKDNIFKILSGILYLGNIEFIKKNNQENLDIADKNKEDLQNASEFFGIDYKELRNILTYQKKSIKDVNEYNDYYDKEKAENIRDSIAKELYSKLFGYIIEKINKKIQNEEDIDENNKYKISILDIFGFENFDENSFEQLCINYANERLQQYFNNEVFKLELEIYKKEGINCDKIEYTDNIKIIELIDKRKNGSIFRFLKDVLFPEKEKNKDQKFRDKVYNELFLKNLKKNKYALKQIEESDVLKYAKNEKNSLYIKHYAGTVKYNVKDMVKKNYTKSNNDIKKAFKESKNTLIKELFKNEKIEDNEKLNGPTITEIFSQELDKLFKKFNSSYNRYIKCIKPNKEKKENNFNREMVLKQMIYGGIEAAFHIKKKGYPIHKNKEDFIKEYKLLFPEINKQSFDGNIKNEIAKIGNNKFDNLYQIGKNIFFMKEELKNSLDEKLMKIKQKIFVLIRKVCLKNWMPKIKIIYFVKKTINIIEKNKLKNGFNIYKLKINQLAEKERQENERKKREEQERIKREEQERIEREEQERIEREEQERIKIEEQERIKIEEQERIKRKEKEIGIRKIKQKIIKQLDEENQKPNKEKNQNFFNNNNNINIQIIDNNKIKEQQNININLVSSYRKQSIDETLNQIKKFNNIELDKFRIFEEEQNQLRKKNEELEQKYIDLLEKYFELEKRIQKMELENKNENSNISKEKIKIIKNNINDNFIIAEIDIKEKDINENIKLICPFKEYKKKVTFEEIKEKCLITINDEEIPFNYYYKFKEEGTYNIKYIFNEKISKANHMFSGCTSLKTINLSNFITENITDMSYMFNGCKNLTNINISNINTQKVTDMSNMFSKCNSLRNIDLSNFNTKNVTNMSYMFNACKSLKTLNLSNFDTKNVINMSFMFNECSSLQNLNLSSFNTKNAINMAAMFSQCYSLKNLNIDNFNTQKVTNMCYMFNLCISLSNINLSSFNTQNVSNMCYMFCLCKSLPNIDLSSFIIQNVSDMRYMFYGCNILSIIKLPNFHKQKDINMDYMFYECFSLANIKDIYDSIIKAQNNINKNNIFYGCNLSEIQNEEAKNINLQNTQVLNEENKNKLEEKDKLEKKSEKIINKETEPNVQNQPIISEKPNIQVLPNDHKSNEKCLNSLKKEELKNNDNILQKEKKKENDDNINISNFPGKDNIIKQETPKSEKKSVKEKDNEQEKAKKKEIKFPQKIENEKKNNNPPLNEKEENTRNSGNNKNDFENKLKNVSQDKENEKGLFDIKKIEKKEEKENKEKNINRKEQRISLSLERLKRRKDSKVNGGNKERQSIRIKNMAEILEMQMNKNQKDGEKKDSNTNKKEEDIKEEDIDYLALFQKEAEKKDGKKKFEG